MRAPHHISLAGDEIKMQVQFLLNAYDFCTIIQLKKKVEPLKVGDCLYFRAGHEGTTGSLAKFSNYRSALKFPGEDF